MSVMRNAVALDDGSPSVTARSGRIASWRVPAWTREHNGRYGLTGTSRQGSKLPARPGIGTIP